MLYDRATIEVEAGAGGDGAMSFRREAHVPRGGPDGGDGGRGGDIVLVCDASLRDLQALRGRPRRRADRGGHGAGSTKHGANGDDLLIRVPPGTVAEVEGSARVDLTTAGMRARVAVGGSGGRGNKRFAGSRRQAPRFAERGLPGEEAVVDLRLKLLADAGLIGLPNAGKSSLLGRITRAAPRVADYPFTTLEPVLGTLEVGERQLVVADIPGLVEGAHAGLGLGHEFLAHVERTRLLVHVVDVAPLDGTDPAESHATVEREVVSYGAGLAGLPRILCLSKADLLPPAQVEQAAELWRERLAAEVEAIVVTSAATGQGLPELAAAIFAATPIEVPPAGLHEDEPEQVDHLVYRPGEGDGFRVERAPKGGFRVVGGAVERLIARHDLSNDDALRYVETRLRSMGVIRALEAAGFDPHDEVEIAGTAFELDPGAPFR